MIEETILLFHFYLLLIAIGACSCVIIKAVKEENKAWKDAFTKGYEMGKNSRIGLNKSGCVCTFDEQGKVATPCQAHLDWRGEK